MILPSLEPRLTPLLEGRDPSLKSEVEKSLPNSSALSKASSIRSRISEVIVFSLAGMFRVIQQAPSLTYTGTLSSLMAQHPLLAAISKGPLGMLAPSFMAVSTDSLSATPSSTSFSASAVKGPRRRFTSKPSPCSSETLSLSS